MIRIIHQVAADRLGGIPDFEKISIQKGKGESYVACYEKKKFILYYDGDSFNDYMPSYTGA